MKYRSLGVTFLAGALVGALLWSKFTQPSNAEHMAALQAAEAARDSLLAATTSNAQVVPFTILQIDTVTDVQLRVEHRHDTTVESLFVVKRISDTVYVEVGEGFQWEFSDETPAYTITGTCFANLRRPAMSRTSYQLDINTKALCAPQRRWKIGGGVYGGTVFAAGGVQVDRWIVGPMLGVGEGLNIKAGLFALYGVM